MLRKKKKRLSVDYQQLNINKFAKKLPVGMVVSEFIRNIAPPIGHSI